jgi:addiction module HigA family antidote
LNGQALFVPLPEKPFQPPPGFENGSGYNFKEFIHMPKPSIPTPGSTLQTFIDEYQITPTTLAKEIGMSQSGIRQITIGQTRITVPVALRLAKYFGTTPDYWINLQTIQDLADAAKDQKLSAVLKAIPKVKKPAGAPAADKPPRKAKPAAAKAKPPAPRTKK